MNQWTVYKERKSLHGGKKKFSLTSAILSVICVVFVAEARRLLAELVILSFLVDFLINCIPIAIWVNFIRIRNNLYW